MQIREFNAESDMEGLRECVISIQDYERNLDPRLLSGKDIVEEYIPGLFEECRSSEGCILVAETHGAIAGYVLLLNRVRSESIEDGNMEYGLIRDLVVLETFRGRGIGGLLLEAAEEVAKSRKVSWLRIEVLSSNENAKEIYLSKGFKPYTLMLEKNILCR